MKMDSSSALVIGPSALRTLWFVECEPVLSYILLYEDVGFSDVHQGHAGIVD